ncbi:MAG: hypothetical protein ACKOVI_02845, partial [Candidatus Planktophila sp.]
PICAATMTLAGQSMMLMQVNLALIHMPIAASLQSSMPMNSKVPSLAAFTSNQIQQQAIAEHQGAPQA